MTEILISLSLLLLITVSDLRLITVYLQADKTNYTRTLAAVRAMSLAERQLMLAPSSTEIFRVGILMSGH